MSCFGIEFVTRWGDTVCIPFYVKIREWPPEPDPWVHFVGPEDPDWFVDLQSLNGIAQLTSGIKNAALQEQVSAAVSQGLADLSAGLPDGVRIGDGFGAVQISG